MEERQNLADSKMSRSFISSMGEDEARSNQQSLSQLYTRRGARPKTASSRNDTVTRANGIPPRSHMNHMLNSVITDSERSGENCIAGNGAKESEAEPYLAFDTVSVGYDPDNIWGSQLPATSLPLSRQLLNSSLDHHDKSFLDKNDRQKAPSLHSESACSSNYAAGASNMTSSGLRGVSNQICPLDSDHSGDPYHSWRVAGAALRQLLAKSTNNVVASSHEHKDRSVERERNSVESEAKQVKKGSLANSKLSNDHGDQNAKAIAVAEKGYVEATNSSIRDKIKDIIGSKNVTLKSVDKSDRRRSNSHCEAARECGFSSSEPSDSELKATKHRCVPRAKRGRAVSEKNNASQSKVSHTERTKIDSSASCHANEHLNLTPFLIPERHEYFERTDDSCSVENSSKTKTDSLSHSYRSLPFCSSSSPSALNILGDSRHTDSDNSDDTEKATPGASEDHINQRCSKLVSWSGGKSVSVPDGRFDTKESEVKNSSQECLLDTEFHNKDTDAYNASGSGNDSLPDLLSSNSNSDHENVTPHVDYGEKNDSSVDMTSDQWCGRTSTESMDRIESDSDPGVDRENTSETYSLPRLSSASVSSGCTDSESDQDADDEFECECAYCLISRQNENRQDWSAEQEDTSGLSGDERILFPGGYQVVEEQDEGLPFRLDPLSPLDLFLMRHGRRDLLEAMFQNVIRQMLAVYPDLLGEQAPPPAPPSSIQKLLVITVKDQQIGPDFTCPICLCSFEVNEEINQLPCRHQFHILCIQAWLAKSGTCPVCRYVLTSRSSEATDLPYDG